MALFMTSIKKVQRSQGQSSTASAAYRLGIVIEDELTGQRHDYRRRGGIEQTFGFAPEGIAPVDPAKLWNQSELKNNRKNSVVARELLMALPHELDFPQREALTRQVAAELAARYGVAGSVAMHEPDAEGDKRNKHAHILYTTHTIDEAGELCDKTRVLDDKVTGPQEILWQRKMVADVTNMHLEAAGLDIRVDHRSKADQLVEALANGDLERARKLEKPSQIHEGPRVTQIRREAAREGRAPLGALDIAAANDSLKHDEKEDRQELAEVVSMIAFIEKRAAEHDAAHGEANEENALRDKLKAAVIEHKKLQLERADLGAKLDQGEPQFVTEARDLKRSMTTTKLEARAWRKEHRIVSKVADSAGIKLETDLKADRAAEAYMKSPERLQARAWAVERKADDGLYNEFTNELHNSKAEIQELKAELLALNKSDPKMLEQIKSETAQAVEAVRPEIDNFVDNHRPEIAAAADMGGVDAWMSSEIIETGNPIIDQLSRKATQFRQRMMREEAGRAEKNEHLMASAVRKAQASFKVAFDSAFRSVAREAEPRIDHAAESRKRAVEAAAAALRATQQAAKPYVPTWKRHDTDFKYEP